MRILPMALVAMVRMMLLMQFPRLLEIMALAGNTNHGHGHHKQGKKFHRRVS